MKSTITLGVAALALSLPATALASGGEPMGDLATLLWYLFAAAAVICAGLAALHPKILYAALSLLGAFGAVAGLLVFLSADFLAVTQVAVYIGGILVLILFAVMLTGRMGSLEATNPSVDLPAALVLALLLCGGLVWTLWHAPFSQRLPGVRVASIEPLGDALLTTYLLPFEVASILLVAVIIGAVIVVRKEVRSLEDSEPNA